MSNVNAINPYSEFIDFLKQVCPDETVSQVVEGLPEDGGLTPEDSTLARSDQERIRDLSQILLPPPTMTPPQLLDVYLSLVSRLDVDKAKTALSSMSCFESAIITAAVHEWATSQTALSEIARQEAIKKARNPLVFLIEKYVSSKPQGALSTLELKNKLVQLANLPTILDGVPTDLLLKAYSLAEQQIVLTLLDKWIETETHNAEEQRKELKQKALHSEEIKEQLFRIELLKTLQKEAMKEPLSQPLFSIITFGCAFSTSSLTESDGSFSSTSPLQMNELLDPLHFPEVMLQEASIFSRGIAMTALTWAAPAAASLLKVGSKPIDPKYLSTVSARAYCFSLEKVLYDPAMTAFLQTRMKVLAEQSFCDQTVSKQLCGAFRALLLLQATVALYKSEMGGVTALEIQSLLQGTLSMPSDSLLSTMGKLINLELTNLSEAQKNRLVFPALERIVDHEATSSLHEPTHYFLSLWNPKYSREVALSSPS